MSFEGSQVRVRIADSLAILSKPVPFKTFQVGNVAVSITLQDIKQESIIPPKAAATFLVEMANSGDKNEKFTLNFWYYDGDGKKAWESSRLAELGPHESKQVLLSVPFTSPGIFDVVAEAHSVPGNELVNATELAVTIPWLTVNLYFLIIVAAVILGISGAGVALLLRRINSAKSR
jgi:hypothetical protein